MRIYKLMICSCLLLATSIARADNNRCNFKTFKRFLSVEKTGHRLASPKPGVKLSEKMSDFEIMCPWQVEVDLNGDNKKDWVGIVFKEGQYSILAYISGSKAYQMINLQKYPYFPEGTYLNVMSKRELSIMRGLKQNKKDTRSPKFALVINQINKLSHAYAWDGKALSHIHAFESQY